jgi:hypothetical protein
MRSGFQLPQFGQETRKLRLMEATGRIEKGRLEIKDRKGM